MQPRTGTRSAAGRWPGGLATQAVRGGVEQATLGEVAGDFVMNADEVQPVLRALRQGGITVISLHNHGLNDEPRRFYTHFWAKGDAVQLAHALRPALDATNVKPPK
ncbi:DUF1259 domain-containing protein [Haloechinothrix halophila]|uniref:DUF1259 domain-containing protein n=1 Tax=Haloechinothrix halophila TaxID=1069073 RepID=UPI0018C8BF29|nr:DUF1259 domain-containing protein [Haloechinothrix halophila]